MWAHQFQRALHVADREGLARYLTRPHGEFDTTPRGEHEVEGAGVPYHEGHLHNDNVDAPIVGTTSIEHLEEAAEAVEMEYLEEPYEPVPVYGHGE